MSSLTRSPLLKVQWLEEKPVYKGGTSMRGKTFVAADYDVFAGLDVDKRSISVTFTGHQGFIRSLHMPYNAEHLLNYVHKHFPSQKVAFVYEAGVESSIGSLQQGDGCRFTPT